MDILPGWGLDSSSSYAPGERQGFSDSRTEQLYVTEDYKIFFVTGQPGAATGRNTAISVRPFHTIDPQSRDALMKTALPWTQPRNHDVTISVKGNALVLRDGVTGDDSSFPLNLLDPDVKARYGLGSDPFAKYGAAESAPPPAAESGEIHLMRPLTFKKQAKTISL